MRTARSRDLTWLLLAAMVAAQWLALVHGVLHVRLGQPGAPQAVAYAASETPHRHAWLDGLFGDHGHAGDCRLYDQSAGGDHAPMLAQADLPQAGAPDLPPRWVQRAWAAALVPLFQARAPPALG